MLLAIGPRAQVFYLTPAMIGRNNNQSQLAKEKSALLRYILWQNDFLSRVFALKMANFVLKVKPKKI